MAIKTGKLLDAIVDDINVCINYLPDGMDLLPTIFYCLQIMRISLWNTTFLANLLWIREFTKTLIHKQLNFYLAMRRVLYRYFKYVIFPAKVISKSPIFLAIYLDIDSEECMFIEEIIKSWDPMHFRICGWYLDCPLKTTPTF